MKIPCACASARASVFLAPVRHLSPARNQCIFTWESGAPENGALVYALASFCRNPSCRLRAVGGGFKNLAKLALRWGGSAKWTQCPMLWRCRRTSHLWAPPGRSIGVVAPVRKISLSERANVLGRGCWQVRSRSIGKRRTCAQNEPLGAADLSELSRLCAK